MMERCEKQVGNKESMKQSEYLYSMLFLFVVVLFIGKLALEARLSFSRKRSFLQGYEFLPYILHRYSHRRHNAAFLLPPYPS